MAILAQGGVAWPVGSGVSAAHPPSATSFSPRPPLPLQRDALRYVGSKGGANVGLDTAVAEGRPDIRPGRVGGDCRRLATAECVYSEKI